MPIAPLRRRRRSALAATLTILLGACSSSNSGNPSADWLLDQAPDSAQTNDLSTESPSTTIVERESNRPSADLRELTTIAGRIVRRTDDLNIVVTSPNGEQSTNLSADSDDFPTQPTWSNDGQFVAWTSIFAEGARLSVAAADGSSETREANVIAPAFFLSWAPDDSSIAGLRQPATGLEFFLADPTSLDVRVVGRGQPFYLDWIDNESVVAAIGGVSLVDIATSADAVPEVRDLREPLGIFQTPAALPNGDVLVAASVGAANALVRLDGVASETIALADGPLLIAVAPAGDRVAVLAAAAEPQSQIISFQTEAPPELASGRVSIIDLDTGDLESLSETNVLAINWSPDGSTLALLQVGERTANWIFVTSDDVSSSGPFVPSNVFLTSYLPFADQYNHASTWWSPDSRAFVISGMIDGDSGIFVDVVTDDFGPVRIGDGDIAFWSPR
jgi:dipeptidyl aminopeptidase/acylaminoacyl peptidase